MQTNPLAQKLFGRAALQGRPSERPHPTRPIGYDAGREIERAAADYGYTAEGLQRMLAAYGFAHSADVTVKRSQQILSHARCRVQARIWSAPPARQAVEARHVLDPVDRQERAARLFVQTLPTAYLRAEAERSLDTARLVASQPKTGATDGLLQALADDAARSLDELAFRARVADESARQRGPVYADLTLRGIASRIADEARDGLVHDLVST